MKPIHFPKSLLDIPYPWNITSFSKRLEERQKLKKNEENIENALISIEISLNSLGDLHYPEENSIPEDLDKYWGFTAEAIADKACQLDKLTYAIIKEEAKSSGFEDLPAHTLEEMADVWLWTTVRDTSYSNLTWLRNNLDRRKDSKYQKEFLRISFNYWDKVPSELSDSIISICSRFPLDESIVFLKTVEDLSPSVSQKEYARDLRKLQFESSGIK